MGVHFHPDPDGATDAALLDWAQLAAHEIASTPELNDDPERRHRLVEAFRHFTADEARSVCRYADTLADPWPAVDMTRFNPNAPQEIRQ